MPPCSSWPRLTTSAACCASLILRLSAFFPPARRRVDSGKMSEPFVYSGSPLIVPDDQPPAAWKGAPPLGGKVPDTACTLADASGPRAEFLRHLIGAGFVALYFYTGEEHQAGPGSAGEGRMDGAALKSAAFRIGVWTAAARAFKSPAPLVVYPVVPLPPAPTAGVEPVLVDADGSLARFFAAHPGTLYLIRPDGHVAARRHRGLLEDLEPFNTPGLRILT